MCQFADKGNEDIQLTPRTFQASSTLLGRKFVADVCATNGENDEKKKIVYICVLLRWYECLFGMTEWKSECGRRSYLRFDLAMQVMPLVWFVASYFDDVPTNDRQWRSSRVYFLTGM